MHEGTHSVTLSKVLNNNVVLARDQQGREVIVVGRGLGFERLQSTLSTRDPRVEKVFVFLGERRARFLDLLKKLDDTLMNACKEIIALAGREFGQEMPDNLHIALPEHIAFALERVALNMEIPNPFLDETAVLYPAEFEVAGRGMALLKERLGVDLPPGEQGFLALHLAAARAGSSVSDLTRQVSLVHEVSAFILGSGRCAPGAVRLLNAHLRELIEQVQAGISTANPMLAQIEASIPGAYARAAEAAGMVAERLGKPVPADEVGFLALQIVKVEQMVSG
ncbi:MAG TPA: PRD domain-containing protein [Symbiobacteriaceae bacterium]|nr:PRD domain-containing protein [Symbiobacteriaceae bacterium]